MLPRLCFLLALITVSSFMQAQDKLLFAPPEKLCDNPAYEPLMELYRSTGGDNWYNNTGWGGSSSYTEENPVGLSEDFCDPCSWYGVVCDRAGKVVALSLPANNLSGVVPPSISNLVDLEAFVISFNAISGGLPQELWSLPKLRGVFAQNNNLTAMPWGELNEPSTVEVVNLKNNDIAGSIPEGLFLSPRLFSLSLEENEFSGEILVDDFSSSSIRYLAISENNLSGSLPEGLFLAPELETFLAGDNFFSGAFPESVALAENLSTFDVSNNDLDGVVPPEVGLLQEVTTFDVSKNNLSGDLPFISDFWLDANFSFADNNFSGCFPDDICFYTERDTRVQDFSGNPLLPWEGDLVFFCGTFEYDDPLFMGPFPIAVCNDGDDSNGIDIINFSESCECRPAGKRGGKANNRTTLQLEEKGGPHEIKEPIVYPTVIVADQPLKVQLTQTTQPYSLSLYSMSGQLVRGVETSGTEVLLEMAEQTSGAFFLEITNGKERWVRKVIKL